MSNQNNVVSAPKKRKKWPWIVGGILALLVIIGIATGGNKEQAASTAETPQAAPTQEFTKQFEAEKFYNSVVEGMSKEEVTALAGDEKPTCTESQSQFGVAEFCNYGNMFLGDKISVSVQFNDGLVASKTKMSG